MNSNAKSVCKAPRLRRSSRLIAAGVVVALAGLLAAPAQATPGFMIRIANLSAPYAVTGEAFDLRAEVLTTCSPYQQGGVGLCEAIDVTVSYWTDTTPATLIQTGVSAFGGPLQLRVPAGDVSGSTLYFRVTAAQVWTRVDWINCLPASHCAKEQTAGSSMSGSAHVM